jgi:hypothetical protein
MVLFIFCPLYLLIGCGMSSHCKFNSSHVSLSSLLSLCICSISVLWHCCCAILCICFVALLCSLWMYISLSYVNIMFVSWQVLYPIDWFNLVWINRMQISEWMNRVEQRDVWWIIIWKGSSHGLTRYYPGICVEMLKKHPHLTGALAGLQSQHLWIQVYSIDATIICLILHVLTLLKYKKKEYENLVEYFLQLFLFEYFWIEY